MRSAHFFVVPAALTLFTGMAVAQTVGFATGPQGTPTNATGAAIAKVVNDASGLQTRAIPNTSNENSMAPLNKGQFEFAIANVDTANEATTGTGTFKGRQLANLRVVTRLLPLNVGLIVRKDSPIQSIADLKGRCYPAEFTAQRGQLKVATSLLANGGLTYKDVNGNPVPNTSRGGEDFVQGRCDSAMMALGAARLKQIDAQVNGIRVIPIDTGEAAMARMKKVVPYGYVYELKPGVLPGVEKPTSILAYDLLLLASAKTPDDVVYKTVKAMHEGQKALATVTPVLRDFDPSKMHTSYEGLQYHPGALRFYKEAGLSAAK